MEKLQKELEDVRASEEKESNAAHAAALEKELKANDRLHKELIETRTAAEETERKLKKNIRELQVAIQTIEEKAGYREDNLRQDIAVRKMVSWRLNFVRSHIMTFHCRLYRSDCKLPKLILMKSTQTWMIPHNHCSDKLKFCRPRSTS